MRFRAIRLKRDSHVDTAILQADIGELSIGGTLGNYYVQGLGFGFRVSRRCAP